MKSRAKTIAVLAITTALMIVLAPLPAVFLLPLLFTAVTRDWKLSLIAGLLFGVISYCFSLMGTTIVSIAFIEAPYIAIVPRIIVGFVTHLVFRLFKKLFRGDGRVSRFLPYSLAGAIGSLTNTALVVGAFALFMPNLQFGEITMLVYIPTILIMGAVELLVGAIVLPPLALGVEKALGPDKQLKTKKQTRIVDKENGEINDPCIRHR